MRTSTGLLPGSRSTFLCRDHLHMPGQDRGEPSTRRRGRRLLEGTPPPPPSETLSPGTPHCDSAKPQIQPSVGHLVLGAQGWACHTWRNSTPLSVKDGEFSGWEGGDVGHQWGRVYVWLMGRPCTAQHLGPCFWKSCRPRGSRGILLHTGSWGGG